MTQTLTRYPFIRRFESVVFNRWLVEDIVEPIYLKVGTGEFTLRGISTLYITRYIMTKLEYRGYIKKVGYAVPGSSTKKYKINEPYLGQYINKHGPVHAPTGQEPILYQYATRTVQYDKR
jgi:hypothetical protein